MNDEAPVPQRSAQVLDGAVTALNALGEIARALGEQAKTEERRAYLREKKREQRARARAAGLCQVCAKAPARPDRSSCDDCVAGIVEWQRQNGWPKASRQK